MIKNLNTGAPADDDFKQVAETRTNRALSAIGSIRNMANKYTGYTDTQVRTIAEALRAAVKEMEACLSANMARTDWREEEDLAPAELKVGTKVRIRGNARDFDIKSTLCVGVMRYDGEVDCVAHVLEAPGPYDRRVHVSIDFIAGYALVDARVNIRGLRKITE